MIITRCIWLSHWSLNNLPCEIKALHGKNQSWIHASWFKLLEIGSKYHIGWKVRSWKFVMRKLYAKSTPCKFTTYTCTVSQSNERLHESDLELLPYPPNLETTTFSCARPHENVYWKEITQKWELFWNSLKFVIIDVSSPIVFMLRNETEFDKKICL